MVLLVALATIIVISFIVVDMITTKNRIKAYKLIRQDIEDLKDYLGYND